MSRRELRRTATVLLSALALVAGVPSSVFAGPTTTPGADEYVTDVTTSVPDPPASDGGQVTAVSHRYEYRLSCRAGEPFEDDSEYGCTLKIECGDEGGYLYHVYRITIATGHREYLGSRCMIPAENEPSEQQVREAFRRTPVPKSELMIQPPDGRTLVNFETILRTEAEQFTRSMNLLGFEVDLEISPSEFRWVHGDGTDQTSSWPGRSYATSIPVSSSRYITHSYTQKGTVEPRVNTIWTARYRVNGGPWQPVNGTVTIEGDPVDLQILEAVPMLVDPDGN